MVAMAFDPLPAKIALTPAVDHWVETKTVWTSGTTQTFRASRDGGMKTASAKRTSSKTARSKNMIREMSLRNALLQRSDNDWLDGLLAEKPEYEGSLRMQVAASAS